MSGLFFLFVASYLFAHIYIVLCPFLHRSTTIEQRKKEESPPGTTPELRKTIERSNSAEATIVTAVSADQRRVVRKATEDKGSIRPAAVITMVNDKLRATRSRLFQKATLDQSQSPLFKMPREIRDIMYTCLSWSFPQMIVMTTRPIEASNSLWAKDEAPSQRSRARPPPGPLRLPYINGLAHTCRQAYEESSHILFQDHGFSLGSWQMLHLLTESFLPRNIQAIQELVIKFHTLQLDRDLGRIDCYSLRNLKALQPFANLTTLNIRLVQDLEDVGDRGLNPKKLIKKVVKASATLEFLQTIVITSSELRALVRRYARMRLDFDDIPGWIYSFDSTEHPAKHRLALLIETLRRVHKPLWPPRKRRRVSKKDKPL